MTFMALGVWWLAILWTYTEAFPRPFDDWKNSLFYVGAGIILIYGMMKRVVRLDKSTGTPRDRTRFIITIVLLYFAIAIISIIMAPTARYEGLLAIARLILWLGAAWVFAQLSTRQWVWLMRVTVLSAAVMATLTWFQSRGTVIFPYSGIFLAPIGHISYYGDFMALSLVMAVGLFFLDPRYRFKLAAGMTIALCMFLIDLGLALSATRASLVGLIAALLLGPPLVGYATHSLKKMGWLALVGGINLIVIFSLPIPSLRGATASTRLQEVTNISQATLDAASSGRWHTYITSLKIAEQRPITGWGLGSFRFVYPEFAHRDAPDGQVSSATWYYHPHNEILHQAVEVGWLGAALFGFGLVYLLYRGFRSLWMPAEGRHDDSSMYLLITAMCGLLAAFVSWQFSTNFLFPVSRLITAFFAGMVWRVVRGGDLSAGWFAKQSDRTNGDPWQTKSTGKPRDRTRHTIPVIIVVSVATLILFANQASIYCVQKEQMARDMRDKRHWADWAVRLAPGAFDPLYIRATVALQTLPATQAAPDVEALYASYPYVPAVLHMMGYLRAQQGNSPEARKLLQHALANDPANAAAKQLLDQLPPAH